MEAKTFVLTDGLIKYSSGKLSISDEAKVDRLSLLLTNIISLILAFSLLTKWFKNNEIFFPLIGLILLTTSIALLFKWFREFRYVEKTLNLADILEVKLIDIKLSTKKVCLVKTNNQNVRRLKFEAAELEEFSKFLKKEKILVVR